MRARPARQRGDFALESAIEELAFNSGSIPLELRLRNYTDVQPQFGLPWSSRALRECYELGARRFGWASRKPELGSMHDGHWHVGYGVAGVSYSCGRSTAGHEPPSGATGPRTSAAPPTTRAPALRP